MQARPISPNGIVDHLLGLLVPRVPTHALRVGVDGAPAAAPGRLADRLVGPLRARGRPAVRIPAAGFLRPASLRYELGREDPDSFYDDWLDAAGLRREVLDPLGPGGSGDYLPALWDPGRDRSARLRRQPAPPAAVVLVDGPLLLGRGLPFDITVSLLMSSAALRRHTAPEQQWTLPAYRRYAEEVAPDATADVVLRVDDPEHPALIRSP